ncbi:MAG: hypothetical protein VX491_12980 [Pseudomonadota bacterium]|nr:hypothetical protein [Pseudomonadota bacterium]
MKNKARLDVSNFQILTATSFTQRQISRALRITAIMDTTAHLSG